MTNESGLEFEQMNIDAQNMKLSIDAGPSREEIQAALEDCGYWAGEKDLMSLTEAVADHWDVIRTVLTQALERAR